MEHNRLKKDGALPMLNPSKNFRKSEKKEKVQRI